MQQSQERFQSALWSLDSGLVLTVRLRRPSRIKSIKSNRLKFIYFILFSSLGRVEWVCVCVCDSVFSAINSILSLLTYVFRLMFFVSLITVQHWRAQVDVQRPQTWDLEWEKKLCVVRRYVNIQYLIIDKDLFDSFTVSGQPMSVFLIFHRILRQMAKNIPLKLIKFYFAADRHIIYGHKE